jgi:hypothetical protein
MAVFKQFIVTENSFMYHLNGMLLFNIYINVHIFYLVRNCIHERLKLVTLRTQDDVLLKKRGTTVNSMRCSAKSTIMNLVNRPGRH